jgi:hypothetical protein
MTTTANLRNERRTKSTRSFTKYLAAIAGTVALAAAGLAFVAPSASADTAPACPTNTAETTPAGFVETTWARVGNDCVATIVTTTSPTKTPAASTYTCPEGFKPAKAHGSIPWTEETTTYPGPLSCVQDPAPVPTNTWKCDTGFVPDGTWTLGQTTYPGDDTCVKTVDKWKFEEATLESHRAKVSEKHSGSWVCRAGWGVPYRDADKMMCKATDGSEVEREDPIKGEQVCAVPTALPQNGVEVACDIECKPAYKDPIENLQFTYICPVDFTSLADPVTETSDCTKVDTNTQTATCPVAGDVLTGGVCVTPIAPDVPESNPPAVAVTTPPAPTVVSAAEAAVPAVVPEPATVPEAEVPAAAVEAATVPEAEPVAIPEAATVPQAVPAGGGSSTNENGPNTSLLLLVFAATAICLGASARLLATRTR